MSTQVNTYVILGTKLLYDNNDYEKYEKYYDSPHEPRQQGLVVLYDGMNGEYIIIGHVLAVTNESSFFEKPIEINPPSEKLIKSISTELRQHFSLIDPKIKVWVVSHYR